LVRFLNVFNVFVIFATFFFKRALKTLSKTSRSTWKDRWGETKLKTLPGIVRLAHKWHQSLTLW